MKKIILLVFFALFLMPVYAEFLYNYTGQSQLVNVTFNQSGSNLNVTFTQKPYIVDSFIKYEVLQSDNVLYYDHGKNATCSGVDGCVANSNDVDGAFDFDDPASGVTLNFTFSNYTNTTRLVIISVSDTATASFTGAYYCSEGGTTSLGTLSEDKAYNYTITGNCASAPEIMVSVNANRDSGTVSFDHVDAAEISYFNISIDDQFIVEETENVSTVVTNVSSVSQTYSTDSLLIYTFYSPVYQLVRTNVSIEYFYNKSINLSIFSSATGEQINVSCMFNNASLDTISELAYFNSSLDNILSCSELGYQGLTEVITPEQDAYNFSMENFILSVKFYDEVTKNLIDWKNISFDLISLNYSLNTSTETGELNLSLPYTYDYTFRFSADDYKERFWNYELSNQSLTSLSVYLLNTSVGTDVTLQVYNQYFEKLPNVLVYVYRYDIDTNSDLLIAQKDTNFEGQASIDLQLGAEFYRFAFEYNNEIKKITERAYINTTYYEFVIFTGEEVLDNFYSFQDISYSNVYFSEPDHQFRFYYTDNGHNIISQACLRAYIITNTSELLYNTTCVTSQSALVSVGVVNVSGRSYVGKSFITIDNNERTLSSYVYTYVALATDFGNLALIMLIMFTLFIVFLVIKKSLAASLIVAPLPTLCYSWLGIIPKIPINYALGLTFMFLILATIVSKNR